MDKNLESWLRGSRLETGAPAPSPVKGSDQAALLGLPVAPLSPGHTGPLSPEEEEGRISSPDLAEPEQDLLIRSFEDEEKLPEEAVSEPVQPAAGAPASLPAVNGEGENVGQTAEYVIPVSPRLFAERRKAAAGRGKKFAAAGFAAAVIAAGAWMLFGRENADDLLARGRELYGGGDYEGALNYYTRAAEKNPAMAEALLGVADALERLDRRGEAVDAYYRCLQAAPGDPLVHLKLGFLFLTMGSYENALRSFHESVNFNPADARAFSGMGRAYEAGGDYAQAVSAYRKALDLSPSNEDRDALKRTEGELSRQNEEAEKRRRDILVRENVLRGRSALSLGDFEEAKNFLLKALDLTPGDHDALIAMGDLNRTSGDLAAAADYYRAALAFHPDSLRAASALAEVEKTGAQIQGAKQVSEEVTPAEKPQALHTGDEAPRADQHVQKNAVSPGIKPKTAPPRAPAVTKRPSALPRPSAVKKPPAVSAQGDVKHSARADSKKERKPPSFSRFWKEMLASSESPEKGKVAALPLKSTPFSEGRWRDITPVSDGPLGRGIPIEIALPGAVKQPPGWAADKEALVEAIKINPGDRSVYLNLALSYLLQIENEKKDGKTVNNEEEKAVYYSLLAHAWLKKGERDKAAIFMNAAKLRARGELLEKVIALERAFMGRNSKGT